MTERENYLRNVHRQGPRWIPTSMHISPSVWRQLRGELEDVLARHPLLMPGFRKGVRDFDASDHRHTTAEPFVDAWGCVRETATEGITGLITAGPLADWGALDSFVPPDPAEVDDLGPADWPARRAQCDADRAAGRLVTGYLPHGHFYLRLGYLREWENFLMDVGSADPRLDRLIAMVEAFNVGLVERWLAIGIDGMHFADDLGAQHGTLLSPAQFRRYITPGFSRLARMCRQAAAYTYLHTDGYVMNILDQLLDWPIDVVNCQDLVNGIDALAAELKGRACINLDVDRQRIVPFGTPGEIDELIEYEVRTLGSAAGGLGLTVGFFPPTPPQNIDAVLSAFEKYRTWWWD